MKTSMDREPFRRRDEPDRRLGRVSARRVPVDEVARVLELFNTRYWDLTAKHFHEKLVADHAGSAKWTKNPQQPGHRGFVVRNGRDWNTPEAALGSPLALPVREHGMAGIDVLRQVELPSPPTPHPTIPTPGRASRGQDS